MNGSLYDNDLIRSHVISFYAVTDDVRDFGEKLYTYYCFSRRKFFSDCSPIFDEVKMVIFSLDSASALGQNGFTCYFFKKSWDILGHDIVVTVTDFFRT